LAHAARIYWELPGTRPVGGGECGRSLLGVEDFAGQALEWVADTRPHHGVRFQLMKGASWFHEDPLNYRVASGWYAFEGWRSAFTGFRCALDEAEAPPAARETKPADAVKLATAREQLSAAPAGSGITISAAGGASRHLAIHAAAFGPERFSLTAPETILWNGDSVMTWRKTPDMTWTDRSDRRAAYEMRFDELRVEAEFLAHDDWMEQRFTAVNLAEREGAFRTSSCFDLQSHPQFYDCELLRTHVLTAGGTFVPLRRLSRGGDCVRWITGPRMAELGEALDKTVMAVRSRDGRWVIGTGQVSEAPAHSLANNALFTCLHADATAVAPASGRVTTRQLFWFIEGNLEDLRRRFPVSQRQGSER
jgi:hypothetical protein